MNSRRYQNASEVLCEGMWLLDAREAETAARLTALRDAVQVGLDDIDAGRYQEFSEATALQSHLRHVTQQVLGRRR